jgi:ribosomal protein S15P/S13E
VPRRTTTQEEERRQQQELNQSQEDQQPDAVVGSEDDPPSEEEEEEIPELSPHATVVDNHQQQNDREVADRRGLYHIISRMCAYQVTEDAIRSDIEQLCLAMGDVDFQQRLVTGRYDYYTLPRYIISIYYLFLTTFL